MTNIVLAGPEPFGKSWDEALTAAGWKISRAADLGELLQKLPSPPGAAAIDESILPDAGALGTIRAKSPGLFLLAMVRIQTPAKLVELLNAGADDVVSSEIPGELLEAKIAAGLRRFKKARPPALLRSSDGEISLDRPKRQALCGSSPLELTKTEFDLLAFILERPGIVLERTLLLKAVWSEGDKIRPATVDKHIEALRKKLGHLGSRIKTRHGIGYAWEAEPDRSGGKS